jgi:hypothetical protein
MKSHVALLSIISILLLSFSSFTFSQNENPIVDVSELEHNGRTIYTFVDQRNIPEEKVDSFKNRISSLYPTIEKITFDASDRTFSIYFTESPEKKDLKSVFSHFNVYEYTLN